MSIAVHSHELARSYEIHCSQSIYASLEVLLWNCSMNCMQFQCKCMVSLYYYLFYDYRMALLPFISMRHTCIT